MSIIQHIVVEVRRMMLYNWHEFPFFNVFCDIEVFTFLDKNSGAEAKRLSRRRTEWTKCFQRVWHKTSFCWQSGLVGRCALEVLSVLKQNVTLEIVDLTTFPITTFLSGVTLYGAARLAESRQAGLNSKKTLHVTGFVVSQRQCVVCRWDFNQEM